MSTFTINLVPGKGTDPQRLIHTLEQITGVNRVSYHAEKNTVELKTDSNFTLHIMDIMNEINMRTDFKSF